MENFFNNVPAIIEQAAKNPLALSALVILAFSFLAYYYFKGASELTRIVMFLAMGCGALMLLVFVFAAAFQPPPGEPEKRSPVTTMATTMATVCVTAAGMCALPPGGQPGVACTCFSAWGPVAGIAQ